MNYVLPYSWRTMYRYRLHAFIVYECFVWSICAIIAIRWDGREHENARPQIHFIGMCKMITILFFFRETSFACKVSENAKWNKKAASDQSVITRNSFIHLAGWSAASHQLTIVHTAVLCYRKFTKHVHKVAAARHLVNKKKSSNNQIWSHFHNRVASRPSFRIEASNERAPSLTQSMQMSFSGCVW